MAQEEPRHGFRRVGAARVGHLVFVSHSLCEHGALVHGHHEEAHRHAPQGRDAAAASGDALEDSGHDHCEPFAVQSFAVSVGPSCVVPTVLDAELLPWSVRPRPGERSIPLLSLAPKSSPPV